MKPKTLRVLLGSSSKPRTVVLRKVVESANKESNGNVVFEIVETGDLVPDIDEKSIRHEDANTLCQLITTAKTNKIIELLSQDKDIESEVDLIICGDMVVGFNGEIREKPETLEEARHFMRTYGEIDAPAVSNACVEVTNVKTRERTLDVSVTKVFFHPMPDDHIDVTIGKHPILSYGGALVLPEDKKYLQRMEGDISTLQGLPHDLTKKMLLEAATKIYDK